MRYFKPLHFIAPALLLTLLLSGCPRDRISDYNRGFYLGFAEDEKYWEGFDDSFDTVPDGPLWYAGSELPWYDDNSYDAGFWDGVWYAYNDGYFVCYDYGFIIGFSEGYDAAFQKNWIAFLLNDSHPEWLDGSFEDGYNDGFSEGSVFGASDYREGRGFNWEAALWDYRDLTDIYLDEVGFGTGEWGDVWLYEWGTDPNEFYKSKALGQKSDLTRRVFKETAKGRAIRTRRGTNKSTENMLQVKADTVEVPAVSYRGLSANTKNAVEQRTFHEDRRQGQASSNLTTTRVQRLLKYQQLMQPAE